MYGTARTAFAQPRTTHAAAHADDTDARLNWLVAFHARDEELRRRFRSAREREEMELMSRPVDARAAYRLLGALLGLLPPAAIFYRLFGGALTEEGKPLLAFGLFALLVAMNVVCWLVGRWTAGRLASSVERAERGSWSKTIVLAGVCGLAWGFLTGAAGGLPFFGFGAIAGVACAVPGGVAAFVAFTIMHRALARGGMIDARHLRPLAWGVTLTFVALILGL
ncbi:MAG TPA: hypothetical protein VEQ42_01375 [Pyrinomonadaceae bacterium]|nr:hypothetical protein [Pyrinomonadaceae bacterium]